MAPFSWTPADPAQQQPILVERIGGSGVTAHAAAVAAATEASSSTIRFHYHCISPPRPVRTPGDPGARLRMSLI